MEQQARIIFERFPPGLQRALEGGSLDKVNEVLGKMSVEEAEEVVEQLGEAGMLSIEEGVIDPNTEDGKAKLKELEKEGREAREVEEIGGSGPEEETEAKLRGLEVEAKEGGVAGGEVEVADVD